MSIYCRVVPELFQFHNSCLAYGFNTSVSYDVEKFTRHNFNCLLLLTNNLTDLDHMNFLISSLRFSAMLYFGVETDVPDVLVDKNVYVFGENVNEIKVCTIRKQVAIIC